MDIGRYSAKISNGHAPAMAAAYTVADFARKHGLSAVRSKEILDKAGNSREHADLLANKAKPAEERGY